jgi:lipoate synthase
MLGLGEEKHEVLATMQDLAAQHHILPRPYQQSREHLPIALRPR